ncbi:hypothetical protein JKP88DRAFT_247396 [Tribonema minus]|uniref:Smr domain-containing protein n=1 Tax=Tribonema minus TaxID=303371 RepID=A0A836CCS8_9STRA|nr:hypothetical protein JKP88DRAFT_247396 [Tribonema minus]
MNDIANISKKKKKKKKKSKPPPPSPSPTLALQSQTQQKQVLQQQNILRQTHPVPAASASKRKISAALPQMLQNGKTGAADGDASGLPLEAPRSTVAGENWRARIYHQEVKSVLQRRKRYACSSKAPRWTARAMPHGFHPPPCHAMCVQWLQLLLMETIEPQVVEHGRVHLVTGQGLHSARARPKSRPVVLAHFTEHPLGFTATSTDPGTVYIDAGSAWRDEAARRHVATVAQTARERILDAAEAEYPHSRFGYAWLNKIDLRVRGPSVPPPYAGPVPAAGLYSGTGPGVRRRPTLSVPAAPRFAPPVLTPPGMGVHSI